MKVKDVSITRKFNLGNYQTMDIHVEASVDLGEDVKEVLRSIEAIINDYYQGRTDKLVAMAKKEFPKC